MLIGIYGSEAIVSTLSCCVTLICVKNFISQYDTKNTALLKKIYTTECRESGEG